MNDAIISTGRSSSARHREPGRASSARWARAHLHAGEHGADVDAQCRAPGARSSARPAGCATRWPARRTAARREVIDTRAICLLRETLAWHHGLADFAFAMQGLGSGAISLAGTPEQRARYLPRVAEGKAHRGLRAVGARGRLGRGGDAVQRARRRRRLRARRREDLDQQRRHRRLLRAVRAHRRGAGLARHLAPSSSMPARRASRSPSAST